MVEGLLSCKHECTQRRGCQGTSGAGNMVGGGLKTKNKCAIMIMYNTLQFKSACIKSLRWIILIKLYLFWIMGRVGFWAVRFKCSAFSQGFLWDMGLWVELGMDVGNTHDQMCSKQWLEKKVSNNLHYEVHCLHWSSWLFQLYVCWKLYWCVFGCMSCVGWWESPLSIADSGWVWKHFHLRGFLLSAAPIGAEM